MKKLKKPLLFTLALLPIAAIGGWFTVLYQMDLYDPSVFEEAVAQLGSMEVLILISVVQVIGYAAFCGFFGYLLSDKLGMMRPIRFEKAPLLKSLLICVVCGVIFSLDYWTFGQWIPAVGEATAAGVSLNALIASVLYGGVIEEVMMRLFVMSLIAWLIWKLFFRRHETAPVGVIIAATVVAALLFAAGHLPATAMMFGSVTVPILLRCFLLNGGFGLLFGWLYSKYGIHYAMLGHALLHIISKTIWFLFI